MFLEFFGFGLFGFGLLVSGFLPSPTWRRGRLLDSTSHTGVWEAREQEGEPQSASRRLSYSEEEVAEGETETGNVGDEDSVGGEVKAPVPLMSRRVPKEDATSGARCKLMRAVA
jgi:hypothetical protein